MEKIAIVIDSTSYLTDEEKERYNIKTVYLNVVIGNKPYREIIDMSVENYYNYLADETNEIPTTSQPVIGDVVATFEKLKKEGYTDVIAIGLSSGISGTYASYSVADLMVNGINIHPFDSEVSAQAEGFYAIKAGKLIEENKTAKEIIKQLEEMKKLSKAYFLVDRLSHLQRSGRLSTGQAVAGSLLKVKPILHFDDKIIVPYQKIRTYKKAIARIYELFDEFYNENKNKNINVCVLHVNDDIKADEIKSYLENNYPNIKIKKDYIGPVISTHLGLGAVAVGWTII